MQDRCTLRNSERTHDRTDKTWTTPNNPHDKPDAQTPTLAHTVDSAAVCQSAVGAAPATTAITLNSPLFAGE
jgi:hypothetical protein